ncbi:MAG: hypothetical protein IJ471_09280, partial [Eubacterium sp.]|nr:hypothetical protein [Eubacterium sp.]
MKALYDALQKKENVRESLIQLKTALKKQEAKLVFEKLTGKNYDFLMRFLIAEDPKVRKHVAGVLGGLRC